ncbi:IS630 family transposase [Saccharothrix sp. CCNWLW140]|uniref:IS630 family transposase n=1 Tax=Saccharothrix sp. CCNWLW140 TaxID=3128895 RepID=UPI00307D8080
MIVEVERAEWDSLLRWKKRSDSFVLVRSKAEAVMLASKGVGADVIAAVAGRSEKTVKGWLRDWRARRLGSVVTGHAKNENAAKLTRVQKEQVRAALAAKPSESGIPVEFWDVPALANLVATRFDVEYRSDSSLHLLMKFCGMSFKLPDSFDKRRDEEAITARMAEVREEVAGLLAAGVEVFAADEVRVEHEAEMRRTWLPVGERTKVYVNRKRVAMSFFGALNLRTGKMTTYRIDGNQDTAQTVLALDCLQRAYPGRKIAIVWDNAGWHKSDELMKWFGRGQQFEGITLIRLPSYAPDHNPTEHVWNLAKRAIANIQRETAVETFSSFESFVKNGTFKYDFEHLPIPSDEGDLV